MGKQRLSEILLFAVGLNIMVGAAAAKLDIVYLAAGVVTGAIFYYLYRALNSDRKGVIKRLLTRAARALD
jgi:hypothetical protein